MKSLTHPFLQGWLEKRKHKKSGVLLSTTKRWFTIENIGPDQEIALCYYQNPSSPSISGWIFLSDVTNFDERNEDGRTWIVIEHPSRTFWLGSLDTHQHHLWVNNLSNYCRRKRNIQDERKSSLRKILEKGNTTKQLEPADARGEFDSLSNRRQSFQMSSDRDFSSELEFIRSITGAKTEMKDEPGETNSISSPFIKHDYDLGYHLLAENTTSIYDELNNDIDGKASIEDSYSKSHHVVCKFDQSRNHSTNRFHQTTQGSENSIRIQRDYEFSDETINSRLSRAILMDQTNDTTFNTEDTKVTKACLIQVDSPKNSEIESNEKGTCNEDSFNVKKEISLNGSITDTLPKEKALTLCDYSDSHKEDQSNISSESASIRNDKVDISLDDDCSFLPDHDFLTADWDDNSVF
jgi:hypothetical protein